MVKGSPSGATRITWQQARASLTALLVMVSDLDSLNSASLARTHNVPRAEIVAALEAERQRRAGR